ncbi:NAD(+) diphosphatase [Wenzhouxiangella sp. XN79A]|uniref:NAD(+) diphosphatase n=1 Tax=Wenzhouxiangella sp. XN79A TaxID=2724193 RepID=UPI00144A5B74|nr:NAD(+) diphosphatase [Wenzhouxiangella sp. XN79A]NKI36139.1 NAD(+) diphosphatase [Wenzhouxiangella sp. XN79A]
MPGSDANNPAPLLAYSGLRLRRTSPLRERDDWREASLANPETRVLPVWRGRNLVAGWRGGSGDARPGDALDLHVLPADAAEFAELVLLGVDGDAPVLAADLSDWPEDRANALADDAGFVDLRQVGPALGAQSAALLSYARGMVHWHRTHRHCGRCGAATANLRGGMLRRCPDEHCGGVAFPRIDPAVIVLVDDGGLHGDGIPRCLLGRAPGWPAGVYSTLAGFVEPGETLEETVAREVREESNIGVENVRYMASQPWPFPSSLMLGFHASARTLSIQRNDNELEDARWFSANELRNAGTWGDDDEICLPRSDSIARYLIESWLAGQD